MPKIKVTGYVGKATTGKWNATIRDECGHSFTTIQHNTMKSAIATCNEAAKKLGWEMSKPWERVEKWPVGLA